jgi:hypothetical protein
MRYLIILILFIPLNSFDQIKIDKAGDFWDIKVDSAQNKIKLIDSVYYSHILQVCDTVSFWGGNFSSCYGGYGKKGTIIISSKDMKSNDIDDICAVLVHESLHLKILMSGVKMSQNEEEALCYTYERLFLLKVPCVNEYLIRHAENQILIMSANGNLFPKYPQLHIQSQSFR